MMTNTRKILMGASALAGALSIALTATAAGAETKPATTFDIPAQPLGESLRDFYRESGEQIVFSEDLVAGRTSPALKGDYTADQALAMLLDGTNLTSRRTSTGVVMIEAPQSGSAAGDGADSGTVAALVVTAQKREENIQDVPIAISAFSQKQLEAQKIEGGFDLLKAIPNVSFSKNNFTSYNFSIRGVGTKAVSATTDPGVSVSFNNAGLIQNRLFEQEYFDIERVEVLRGPQGTLYGRNATSGVINVISAKPNLTEFDGWVKGEVGNYHTKRVSAMVNIPLVEDKLAVRFAGALTDRQGYDYNSVTKHHVNGRDLWSGRITIEFDPTKNIRTNLIWERFNEDDNRSRTGKQLCHRDDGPAYVGSIPTQQHNPFYLRTDGKNFADVLVPALFSQGCKPGSLYEDAAFGTPNGLALPFVFGNLVMGTDMGQYYYRASFNTARTPNDRLVTILDLKDPYGGMMQSRDLRTIASFRDPVYRAKADVVQLNADIDLNDWLTLSAQSVYDKDQVYSFQDFNRFNTQPVFNDSTDWLDMNSNDPSPYRTLSPGGYFCDPQLGCSNTLAGFDISQARSEQFGQEFRLQSHSDGPLTFSVGANYTRFNVLVDYYIFYNLITAMAMLPTFNTQTDITLCGWRGGASSPVSPTNLGDINDPASGCPYIDPNPIESINGEGHNYFRSKNPYHLKSSAVFGEVYWQINEILKLTAGARYTDDRKTFTPVPSQILLSTFGLDGGTVNRGYPEKPPIKQRWGEWTGRLGVDWKPDLPFTDDTMFYAFYSHGYKGGGANPPLPGFATVEDIYKNWGVMLPKAVLRTPLNYPETFRPEFVNSFELGSKNTLLGGALVLNGDVFLYDYKDYQVSKIVERSAINENFDARIWGLELESTFAPTRNLNFIFNLGYLDTKIGNGAKSIDLMDRTAGNPNYIVVKPWFQLPSNCVVPLPVAEQFLRDSGGTPTGYYNLCGGFGLSSAPFDPTLNAEYDPANYPELNGGAGLNKNLAGNELPNSPHWTANFGAQYGFDLLEGWRATIRGDAYWQSQSWARVYNDNPYDKLHGWYNANLSVWIEKPDDGLKIEFYVKNLLDKTPITDAFLNSDDTALTTNVFTLDPRLIGLSIRKGF